jgi:hypothetical protein
MKPFTALALALSLLAAPALSQTAANPEMARMFAEDQADRTGTIDWKTVAPRDEARLAEGALTTAEDFHAAAFVFQHGSTADDYLLAHTLAMAAVAKGKADSMWIATATLDRYLMQIGQPQVYGTQFRVSKPSGSWTQEPYNRALVSDALRKVLGVRTQAEQAEQLAKLPSLQPAPARP